MRDILARNCDGPPMHGFFYAMLCQCSDGERGSSKPVADRYDGVLRNTEDELFERSQRDRSELCWWSPRLLDFTNSIVPRLNQRRSRFWRFQLHGLDLNEGRRLFEID